VASAAAAVTVEAANDNDKENGGPFVVKRGSYGESDAFRFSLRFRQVLCTTGPNMLSQALFEALLRTNFTTMQAAKEAGFLSLVQADFKPYGGVAKLPTYFTKLDPSFYVFGMRNLSVRLLQRYAPLPHKQLQGHCLTNLERKVFWLGCLSLGHSTTLVWF